MQTSTNLGVQSQIITFIPNLTAPIVRNPLPPPSGPKFSQTNLHRDLILKTKHIFGHPQQPKTNNVY